MAQGVAVMREGEDPDILDLIRRGIMVKVWSNPVPLHTILKHYDWILNF